MKFESKFGIGEILITNQKVRGDRINQDVIGECIGISFQVGASPVYCLRIGGTGQTHNFMEAELIGDPDFNQENGYPTEPGA